MPMSLHPIILLPKIAASATRPPIDFNGLKEQILDSSGPFIVAADEVDQKPRMAINTAMHIESPRLQFVAVEMPKGIGWSQCCIETSNEPVHLQELFPATLAPKVAESAPKYSEVTESSSKCPKVGQSAAEQLL
jgi:hypothetical protein